ncbi:MAG: hypothetical protein R2713_20250 [Ilumatobacteraceae bacterium]
MLAATLLALTAAVLHAGWNLAVKQAATVSSPCGDSSALASDQARRDLAVGGFPAGGWWRWAALSGTIHVPYCWFLARAYDHGDFSLVYPMARWRCTFAAIGGLLFSTTGSVRSAWRRSCWWPSGCS